MEQEAKKWSQDVLVTPAWLKERLKQNDVKVIDATWSLDRPNYAQEFVAEHIPNAVFFDINKVCDTQTDLPHMIPSAATFAQQVGAMGIGNNDNLVIYDRSGNYVASARVWWTFRVFGHDVSKLKVLEGGLLRWKEEGGEVEAGPEKERTVTVYKPSFNDSLVQSLNQMLENIQGKKQIADARSYGRFIAKDPEPRPVRGGHMPNSKNVPFLNVLEKPQPDAPWYSFKSSNQLVETFQNAGIDTSKPVVTTCGSGVTASVLALGLHLAGSNQYAVYDGSWAEWGNAELNTPVIKGEDTKQ